MKLRNLLFNSIIIQEIAFFDENKSGELLNRLSSDCKVLENCLTGNFSLMLRGMITLIVGIFMLFYISWVMCLMTLSITPIIILITIYYGSYIKKVSSGYQNALAQCADVASEAITNIRTVKSFAQEEFEMQKYYDNVLTSFFLAKKRALSESLLVGIVSSLINIGLSIVLWYGGNLVINGKVTAGNLTGFIIYTLAIGDTFSTITTEYTELMKASGSSERVFHLIDRIPKIRYKGGLLLPSKIKGEVIMENIHFSYPSRPDVEVLKGLNLKLAPGTITALVGKSGGGKSTIVSLLEGFYYPTKGKILLDGIDIQNIDPHDLHKHIGIVSQEPILFGTTIANNISYGNHNVSINKIIEVSKLSNSHSFISSFPEGYNTIVGERGIRLSGGQKQRIAIARALLIDPTLLLLDEATSALDSESEFLVREALERLMKGRTVLIIAHRLSTVKNADLVCVVENGKIIEQGTHSQLLFNPSGIYAKLVKRQLQID